MTFAKTTFAAFAFAALIGAAPAFAADKAASPTRKMTPQQQKMKDCSAEAKAKGLKGKEYIDFRTNCLKADSTATTAAAKTPATATPAATAPATAAPAPATASAKPVSQQDKMKLCNAQAGNRRLVGDARKSFMSTCLKGDNSPAPAPAPATH